MPIAGYQMPIERQDARIAKLPIGIRHLAFGILLPLFLEKKFRYTRCPWGHVADLQTNRGREEVCPIHILLSAMTSTSTSALDRN